MKIFATSCLHLNENNYQAVAKAVSEIDLQGRPLFLLGDICDPSPNWRWYLRILTEKRSYYWLKGNNDYFSPEEIGSGHLNNIIPLGTRGWIGSVLYNMGVNDAGPYTSATWPGYHELARPDDVVRCFSELLCDGSPETTRIIATHFPLPQYSDWLARLGKAFPKLQALVCGHVHSGFAHEVPRSVMIGDREIPQYLVSDHSERLVHVIEVKD